ncbi:Thymocyte nuclear protein 1 [Rhynchospora pubera]|uniref:Thymocyte nuclear protein 1 n=1 Tax=Rhynchospora pubera TaxID=906938 RepID=A0AAV8DSM9_9POAL|nr:Thymocyte nuclear protein 1 [Rhynchospora pubera]
MLSLTRPLSVRPRFAPKPLSLQTSRCLPLLIYQASNKPMAKGKKSYWLLKTEPNEWSWDDQRANGGVSQWDGVRNRQAVNNLKSMRPGDLCSFYHSVSGAASRRIVGVVRVTKPWYLIGDGDIDGAVDVKEIGELQKHVELKEIKKAAEKEAELKGFALIKQPRLSVVPVSEWVWEQLCEMGGGFSEGNELADAKEE